MRYKAMVDGLAKELKDPEDQEQKKTQKKEAKKRPRTALNREIQYK